jgi:hypothetical protein
VTRLADLLRTSVHARAQLPMNGARDAGVTLLLALFCCSSSCPVGPARLVADQACSGRACRVSRIAQVVVGRELHERSGDAGHWRDRPPAERLAAVEQLRRQQHGERDAVRPRLQRVSRVLGRT